MMILQKSIRLLAAFIIRSLQIRVMEGRMKGQAFVTFPSVELAREALTTVNGYLLKDKPIVVVSTDEVIWCVVFWQAELGNDCILTSFYHLVCQKILIILCQIRKITVLLMYCSIFSLERWLTRNPRRKRRSTWRSNRQRMSLKWSQRRRLLRRKRCMTMPLKSRKSVIRSVVVVTVMVRRNAANVAVAIVLVRRSVVSLVVLVAWLVSLVCS